MKVRRFLGFLRYDLYRLTSESRFKKQKKKEKLRSVRLMNIVLVVHLDLLTPVLL